MSSINKIFLKIGIFRLVRNSDQKPSIFGEISLAANQKHV